MIAGMTTKCVNDVIQKLSIIPELKGKIVEVYNDNDFLDKAKGVVLPMVGVFAPRNTRNGSGGGDTSKSGKARMQHISLLILSRKDNISNANMKISTNKLIDAIRNEIFETQSPSGHLWELGDESYTVLRNEVVVYIQQWQTTFTLSKIERAWL